MMKRTFYMRASLLMLAAIFGGCGGGSSNNPPSNGGGPTPPPEATSLTTFVHTELAQTSDSSEPTDINGITFAFPDDDNPAAFNDVVGSP